MSHKQHIITEGALKAEVSEKVAAVTSRVHAAEHSLALYKKEHGKLELFFSELGDALQDMQLHPLKMDYVPKSKSKVASPCSAVMCINDTHMGSVQLADEIEGFNEFNPEICVRRCMQYAKDALDWVRLHRNSYIIDELVILVLGDNISGDIHDELKITNAFPAPVQVTRAAELLAAQVSYLAPHFKTVRIEFISEDNHARLTPKPQCKEAGYNSFNYIVGYIAKSLLSAHKNVIFNIYPMYEKVITVAGRQYLICHGHGVQGWGGVPWYGIERKVGKESMNRLQVIMQDTNRAKSVGFHKYVFGHWHTPVDLPLYSCSASVSGTDAYDHKNSRFAVPSQAAWIVHPKRGEFDRINFQLD